MLCCLTLLPPPKRLGHTVQNKKAPREQIDMDAMKPVWPPLPTLETTQQVALIKDGRKRVSNAYY